MNIEKIVEKIILIPVRHYKEGNVSTYSLLKESGYFEIYDQINEEKILNGLNNNPDSIDFWLMLSEDQRTDRGWYFRENDNGKFIVGYFSKNENFILPEYGDIRSACAAFIVRDIEMTRKI